MQNWVWLQAVFWQAFIGLSKALISVLFLLGKYLHLRCPLSWQFQRRGEELHKPCKLP